MSESLLNSSPHLAWEMFLAKRRESPMCSQQTVLTESGIVSAREPSVAGLLESKLPYSHLVRIRPPPHSPQKLHSEFAGDVPEEEKQTESE